MNRAAAAAALLVVAAVAVAGSRVWRHGSSSALVTNGGFEDGLDGWTSEGSVSVVSGAAVGDVGADGWTLVQSNLDVAKGRTYRVAARVRGTGGTLSLWTEEKGPLDAQRVAVWEDVPADWTPVAAYVTAAHNGKLTLRFEASATTAGGKGRVALDDVSIAEATLPVATQVEPGKGFDDEPSMARDSDGTYYVAWISWRDGADTIQASRFKATSDGSFEKLGTWQVAGGHDAALRAPLFEPGSPSASSRDVCIRYQIDHDGARHNAARWLRADGPSNAIEVTVSNPIRRRDLELGPPVDAFVDVRDEVRGDDFAIVLNKLRTIPDPSDKTPQVLLTKAPTIDRRPSLFDGPDGQWLLYENVETPGYRVSFETAHHVVVAKIDGDHLLAPKNYMSTSPLWDRAQSPAAAFDDKGRLWVAYRKPRLPNAGWDVYLTGWTGDAWVPPIPVSSRKGMNRRPSLVLDGNRAIVCYQADDLPEGWGDIAHTKDATSGVYLTSVELPDVPAAPHELEPLVENPAKWEAAEIRHRFGDDAAWKRNTEVGGETLTLLFGDLHSHSDTSVCERLMNGDADDVYAMQRDFEHLDFACLTDHAEDMNPYLWNRNAKLARANDVPGKFTVFLGEEWASSFQTEKDKDAKHPYGYYGHRTLIFGDLHVPRWWNPQDRSTPRQLWDELRAAKVDFVSIPHQLADVGTNVPVDWDFADETAEPVAEIFQVRGSYEAKGAPRAARAGVADPSYWWQGALKRGVVIGAIASPDHGGGLGKACVWAKENSRAAILDALRKRRCYGTTGARIALDVNVNGHVMGEKTTDGATGDVQVFVYATCPNDPAKVSICRNGEWIHEEALTDREVGVVFVDKDPPPGPKWYYVRIEQLDGELAWSSPVWLGASK